MLRKVASRVAWAGRTASMVFGVALILALVFGALSVAAAHTGSAGLLHLAHNNFTTALTTLTGNVNGPAMQVVNNNADANDTALSLNVQSGEAPMRVNSGTKVANLNADKLDNREASSFANGVGGKATDADKLDGLDSRALRVDTSTSGQLAHTCDTPQQYNECAWIGFTVPAGKHYVVSVWSDISARVGSSNQVVSYCSAIRKTGQDLQCMSPANTSFPPATTFWASAYNSAGTSGEAFLSEGNYTVSTALYPEMAFVDNSNAMVITKVMFREWTGV